MADLDQFPPDIYQTLIALPYRVGLFISESDKTGGSESSARELAALENVVTFYVEDTLKSEFAQDVMLATLQHKAFWKDWSTHIDNVPDECKKIILFLEDHIDGRKLFSFKGNLLEIGTTVAMAYRETSGPKGFFKYLKSFFKNDGNKKTSDGNAYLNISSAEKTAINRLAEIFGMEHRLE